jgi:hypothetical protein
MTGFAAILVGLTFGICLIERVRRNRSPEP